MKTLAKLCRLDVLIATALVLAFCAVLSARAIPAPLRPIEINAVCGNFEGEMLCAMRKADLDKLVADYKEARINLIQTRGDCELLNKS